MPNAIRLLLDPVPGLATRGITGDPALVAGVALRFSLFGSGSTAAAKASPKPATITFTGTLSRAEPGGETKSVELGTLEGEVRLEGTVLRAVFCCTAESLSRFVQSESAAADTDADVEAEPRPRVLQLQLAAPDFEGLEPVKGMVPQITLPEDADEYHYLQLQAVLSVAGASEGDAAESDTLDVPIWGKSPPLAPAYEVQVIDEIGEPVPDATLEFDVAGTTKTRTTNAGGVATVVTQTKANATVSVTNAPELEPELKARWKKVRGLQNLAESQPNTNRFPRELPTTFGVQNTGRHLLCIRPPVVLARLHGTYFAKNKCFLLPTAVPSLQELVAIYDENEVAHSQSPTAASTPEPRTEVLIVGHTDTSGDKQYNIELSAERAESLTAYLLDDSDSWLAWFGSGKPEKKRWGAAEESMMIGSLVPDDEIALKGETQAYQEWHNAQAEHPSGWKQLEPDGVMGPETRKQLVIDYMNHDATSLDPAVRVVGYGCGEMFPMDATTGEVDAAPADGSDEQEDRCVEVFLFSRPFGILPPVPGVAEGAAPKKATRAKDGEQEYLEWRRRTQVTHSLSSSFEEGVPVFEWSEELDGRLPADLVLRLEEEEGLQELGWSEGISVAGMRRFVFGGLTGASPCTLTAVTGSTELVLLDNQPIHDPSQVLHWTHWLEELAPTSEEAAYDADASDPGPYDNLSDDELLASVAQAQASSVA